MGRKYSFRRRNRRSKRVSKTWAKSKKGRKSQSSQILTLQRQITRIERKVMDNTKWCQFKYPLTSNVGGIVSPTYGVWNLINPNLWEPVFQARSEGFQNYSTASKFRGRSLGLEMMCQIGPITEGDPNQDPVTCTIFLCSLRKEVAKQFVHDTSNGVDLVEGVHYSKASMGTLQGEGMVMLNKGIFKIRKAKRFMLGGNTNFYEDGPDDTHVFTTNLKDNNRRIYWKIPYRNLLKDDGPDSRTGESPSGWKTLTLDDIEPSDQLYVFMFANAYADQAVAIHANVIITGQVAN